MFVHQISDIKEFPKNLSVQDILIRSSNIGTLIIARKLEKKNLKNFLMILIYKNIWIFN